MVKAWGLSRVNDIIDPPVGVAIELIQSGRAVAVEDGDEKAATDRWHKRIDKPPKGKPAKA
jgi:hypothetical protein